MFGLRFYHFSLSFLQSHHLPPEMIYPPSSVRKWQLFGLYLFSLHPLSSKSMMPLPNLPSFLSQGRYHPWFFPGLIHFPVVLILDVSLIANLPLFLFTGISLIHIHIPKLNTPSCNGHSQLAPCLSLLLTRPGAPCPWEMVASPPLCCQSREDS